LEKQAFISLIDRCLAGQASELEEQQLANYAHSFQDQDWDEMRHGSKEEAIARMRGRLLEQITEQPVHVAPVRRLPLLRTKVFRYAAAILFLVAGLGTLLLLKPRPSQVLTQTAQVKVLPDVQPAAKKAYITLGDGKQYELAALKTGEHVGEAVKTADGKLVYSHTTSAVTYNTLTVPRGGAVQYVELADHSKVWLNTASSITYPTRFDGNTREVTITGEAYFEVAKTGQTFVVKTRTDKIEVLGTHFNIHAYDDETVVKTTLLEGRVRIGNTILKPGEQYANGAVAKANTGQVMAWRNGLFSFGSGVDVQTLMRDLSRWYDVTVVFEGAPTQRIFEGDISRSLTLKEALEGLQFTALNYRIEQTEKGTRIVMTP
jgi:ferric-dicitrate binding protein FerR (iron transport regulator)